MAWPPVPSATFLTTNTTIEWGTDGIMTGGSIGAGGENNGDTNSSTLKYIVKRIHSADNQEVIYIPNGTGLNAIRIQLWHGRNVEVVVVAQSGFAHPAPETQLQVVDPLSKTLIVFRATASAYEATRKAEGERTISAVIDWLIDNSGSVVVGVPAATTS